MTFGKNNYLELIKMADRIHRDGECGFSYDAISNAVLNNKHLTRWRYNGGKKLPEKDFLYFFDWFQKKTLSLQHQREDAMRLLMKHLIGQDLAV